MSAKAKATIPPLPSGAAAAVVHPHVGGKGVPVELAKKKKSRKNRRAEDMPLSQQRKLRQLCSEQLKDELILTKKAADVMDPTLQAIVSKITGHANELRHHAGRVKLGAVNVLPLFLRVLICL